jgi:hypothetical protein
MRNRVVRSSTILFSAFLFLHCSSSSHNGATTEDPGASTTGDFGTDGAGTSATGTETGTTSSTSSGGAAGSGTSTVGDSGTDGAGTSGGSTGAVPVGDGGVTTIASDEDSGCPSYTDTFSAQFGESTTIVAAAAPSDRICNRAPAGYFGCVAFDIRRQTKTGEEYASWEQVFDFGQVSQSGVALGVGLDLNANLPYQDSTISFVEREGIKFWPNGPYRVKARFVDAVSCAPLVAQVGLGVDPSKADYCWGDCSAIDSYVFIARGPDDLDAGAIEATNDQDYCTTFLSLGLSTTPVPFSGWDPACIDK